MLSPSSVYSGGLFEAHTKHLSISGGAIVSGSFHAFDQTYLVAALKKLGPSFVGVKVEEIEGFAKRVYELVRWPIEFYVDARELTHLSKLLLRLPQVSIDHLGLSKESLPALLALVEKGIKVKATGFGKVEEEKTATQILYSKAVDFYFNMK